MNPFFKAYKSRSLGIFLARESRALGVTFLRVALHISVM